MSDPVPVRYRHATALLLAALLACWGASRLTTLGAQAPSFPLEEKTIAQLQQGLERGDYTSRQLVEMYLARIDALDRKGPMLRAVIETNPDALAEADRSDRERRDRGARGPLHGIPILLKDNIGTADGMTTTAGSLALEGSRPAEDAFLVQRLREAGAILLGKTNMSEWANFRSTRSSSGWSARGGQARNPYVLDRNPCGSSSGSGSGVAASYAAAAVGTETDGSIVCPSSINGIVGVKPTLGLISRSGVIPIAHSQDTAGPMARTVADAALLLGAMTGVDQQDPATAASAPHLRRDYTAVLRKDGLKGARIGVARSKSFNQSPEVKAIVDRAVEALRAAGATVVDPVEIPNLGEYDESEFEVLLYEFKADLNRYLQGLGPEARVKSLADVIAFNEKHRDREMPWFGQEIMEMAQKKGPLTDADYKKALARNRRLAGPEGLDAALKTHRLDAIVAPTGGPAWPTDLVNGDHFSGGSSSAAAVAGYPNITVPAGFVAGLPVGISFMGTAWSEPTLLRLAYAYEQATSHREPPRFLPTLPYEPAPETTRPAAVPSARR